MKKVITLIMTLMILCSFTVTSFAITFTDVAADAWYNSFVYALAEEGVINGYEENGVSLYKPDNMVPINVSKAADEERPAPISTSLVA